MLSAQSSVFSSYSLTRLHCRQTPAVRDIRESAPILPWGRGSRTARAAPVDWGSARCRSRPGIESTDRNPCRPFNEGGKERREERREQVETTKTEKIGV
jgi:hypothetical protein